MALPLQQLLSIVGQRHHDFCFRNWGGLVFGMDLRDLGFQPRSSFTSLNKKKCGGSWWEVYLTKHKREMKGKRTKYTHKQGVCKFQVSSGKFVKEQIQSPQKATERLLQNSVGFRSGFKSWNPQYPVSSLVIPKCTKKIYRKSGKYFKGNMHGTP